MTGIDLEADVAIVGSGMGGPVLARALGEQGIRTVVLERGTRLPRSPENWSPHRVFVDDIYKNSGAWLDASGGTFKPGVHYWVGGNTKVYGGSLVRFREQDFEELRFREGASPGWPFRYADLEPYYAKAEQCSGCTGRPARTPPNPGAAASIPTRPWSRSPTWAT